MNTCLPSSPLSREQVPDSPNRLGISGIEFIEYTTTQPQALGKVLERMGFAAVARHRSREVTLYRQGQLNLVVVHTNHVDTPQRAPMISAVGLRVRDALLAHQRCLELGAWPVPSQAQAMELHIPAILGPGGSRFYFVDRWQEFSIYDIDFNTIGKTREHAPIVEGMSWFGVVQYIGNARSLDWATYFERMFDFELLPDQQRFGILPKGHILRSPCGQFFWQIIEPDPALEWGLQNEQLQRVGIGVNNVPQAVRALQQRGVEFVDSSHLHPDEKGALTRNELGSVVFELVHHPSDQPVRST